MLIDTFINAIFLYDDKMVITFNYKEGTKTITLAELPEAISNKTVRIWIAYLHQKTGAVREVCRCEPVTDVTGVAAPRLNENSLVLLPRCSKIRGIATPACALVRNDSAFSNSPFSVIIHQRKEDQHGTSRKALSALCKL